MGQPGQSVLPNDGHCPIACQLVSVDADLSQLRLQVNDACLMPVCPELLSEDPSRRVLCSKGKASEQLRGLPYLLPLQEITRRTAEAWDRGASEVCMQGGIHPGKLITKNVSDNDCGLDLISLVRTGINAHILHSHFNCDLHCCLSMDMALQTISLILLSLFYNSASPWSLDML